MTTLADLVSDVYTLTNRPDLVAETNLAVKAATLKMHQMDFWPKDLFETGLQFDSSDYIQILPYKALLPKWRAFKYLRKFDTTTSSTDSSSGTPGDEFTMILPEQVLDGYGVEKTDICYLAGTNINIKSSTPFQFALLGCYLVPDVTDAGYSSWLADEHRYAIVTEATRRVFKTIGFDEQSASYEKLVGEEIEILRTSQVLGQGY